MKIGSLFDGIGVSEDTRRKMSDSAKRRCSFEWRLHQSQTKATRLDVPLLRKYYLEDGRTQKEIAELLGVTQKVIWRCMKNNGIETRKAYKRNQYGKDNDYWKGGRIIDEAGYIKIKTPNHPRAKECGDYVPEHILVVEEHLGRYLKWYGPGDDRSEIVHHINGNKQDNCIDNLLVTNFREHMAIHRHWRKEVMPNAE